jgi:hypothetical protein
LVEEPFPQGLNDWLGVLLPQELSLGGRELPFAGFLFDLIERSEVSQRLFRDRAAMVGVEFMELAPGVRFMPRSA